MTSAPAPRPPVRGRRDTRPEEALELPHERDQSLRASAEQPEPVIAQARRDRHHQPLVTEEPVKESPEEAAEQARQRSAASSESGPVIEGSRRRR